MSDATFTCSCGKGTNNFDQECWVCFYSQFDWLPGVFQEYNPNWSQFATVDETAGLRDFGVVPRT